MRVLLAGPRAAEEEEEEGGGQGEGEGEEEVRGGGYEAKLSAGSVVVVIAVETAMIPSTIARLLPSVYASSMFS